MWSQAVLYKCKPRPQVVRQSACYRVVIICVLEINGEPVSCMVIAVCGLKLKTQPRGAQYDSETV